MSHAAIPDNGNSATEKEIAPGGQVSPKTSKATIGGIFGSAGAFVVAYIGDNYWNGISDMPGLPKVVLGIIFFAVVVALSVFSPSYLARIIPGVDIKDIEILQKKARAYEISVGQSIGVNTDNVGKILGKLDDIHHDVNPHNPAPNTSETPAPPATPEA